MTTVEISAEVVAQAKRFETIRRTLFENRCEQEDILNGGMRAVCLSAESQKDQDKQSSDEPSPPVQARRLGLRTTAQAFSALRPQHCNAFRSSRLSPPLWEPINLTPQDILSLDLVARQSWPDKVDAGRIVSVSRRSNSLPYDLCQSQPPSKSVITPAVPMSCRSTTPATSSKRPASAMPGSLGNHLQRACHASSGRADQQKDNCQTESDSKSKSSSDAQMCQPAVNRVTQTASKRATGSCSPLMREGNSSAAHVMQVHALEHVVCGSRRMRAQSAPSKRRSCADAPASRPEDAALLMLPRPWTAKRPVSQGKQKNAEKHLKVVSVSRGMVVKLVKFHF